MEAPAAGRSLTPLVIPDLGIEGMPIRLSLWLMPRAARVLAGDRVVELVAGGATVDLTAPVTGRLVRRLVDEDAAVVAGMVVAEFMAEDGAP